MLFNKTTCLECGHEFKGKDARFCPKCGKAIAGSHADIAMIVDRSGSMASCHPQTITGFNKFLREQKEAPGTASLTVAEFDNVYEILLDRKPIGEVAEVDATAFTPRGSTALFDAIGRTLAHLECHLIDGGRCLVCIITDGEENASKESTLQQVQDMIRRLESKGWGFIYLGANLGAFHGGQTLGIKNVAQYLDSNTEQAYGAISCNASAYRAGGSARMNQIFGTTVATLNK